MEKVLITGGAGFIGSHITDKLLENNYNVVVVDNLSAGNLNNLPDSDNLKFYNCDISDDNLEDIFKIENPDYVIHLAAQTSVAYSVLNPTEDAKMNILGSIKVVELSKKYKIKKFLTASSAAVYGVPKYLPIDENHPTEPISQYGLSKLTMEKYIKLSGIPYVIFRFSNAYGPRQRSSKESGVIAIFDNAMKNNKPIHIYGDGNQIRDFIYVEDIANICVKTIKSDIVNKTFNFSTNKGETLNDLFSKMKKIYRYDKNAIYLPEREGEIKDSILSDTLVKSLFNDIKMTELNSGLNNLNLFELPKISVIVSYYNASEFIDRNINSILSQTYKNWELICVNDQSSDNTLEILKQYESKDKRIKVLNNNKRKGKAAPNFNRALEFASGEFIFLLGHDDDVSSDLFEKLIKRQKETNADIVIPDCCFVYPKNEAKNWTIAGILNEWEKTNSKIDRTPILNNRQAIEYSIGWRIHGFNLIRASIAKKNKFLEDGMNGDEYSIRKFYFDANKIAFSEGEYNYYQINSSITKKMTPKIFDTYKTPYNLEKLLIKKHFPYNLIESIDKSRHTSYEHLKNLYKENKEKFTDTEKEKIEKLLKENETLLKKINIKRMKFGRKIFSVEKSGDKTKLRFLGMSFSIKRKKYE